MARLGLWILVSVSLSLLLPLALQSTSLQRQLVFLHGIGWPPVRFRSPELAHMLPGLPSVSRYLGLHPGLPRTQPHWLLNEEGEQIGDLACATS